MVESKYHYEKYVRRPIFTEWKMKTMILPGLGNHYYENNVGHCVGDINYTEGFGTNSCAHMMVKNIWQLILSLNGRLSNYRYDAWDEYNGYHPDGSFMYGFDVTPRIHMIQNQNHPSYHVLLDDWVNLNMHIYNNENLLLDVTMREQAKGKMVIWNWHYNYIPDKINDAITSWNVNTNLLMIFNSHSHFMKCNAGSRLSFNSGAMFKRDFMALDMSYNNIKIYTHDGVTNNKLNYCPEYKFETMTIRV